MNDNTEAAMWAERVRLAFRLDGDVAIVTGAARGIGRAIAAVLGGAGAHVILTDVLQAELDETVEALRSDGIRCEGRLLDVSSRSAVFDAVNGVVRSAGKLDVMVNNAAIIADTSALHVSEAEVDRIHGVNFKGAMFGSQAAASVMVPRQKGSIVSILSAAIDLPAPTVPALRHCQGGERAVQPLARDGGGRVERSSQCRRSWVDRHADEPSPLGSRQRRDRRRPTSRVPRQVGRDDSASHGGQTRGPRVRRALPRVAGEPVRDRDRDPAQWRDGHAVVSDVSTYGVYPPTASEIFTFSADAMAVRRGFEEFFITHGYGPDPRRLAADLNLSRAAMLSAMSELQRGIQIMFVPGTDNVIKMPPFSYVPTRHVVSIGDVRRWYAGCAGEACAFSKLFPGSFVLVNSYCPHCDETIRITMKDGVVLHSAPEESVIHLGIHPLRCSEDWISGCDSLNFFPGVAHVERWEEMVPTRRGVHFPVALGPEWVDHVASQRFWNYERGPETVSPEGVDKMISWFESHGVDTRPWTAEGDRR